MNRSMLNQDGSFAFHNLARIIDDMSPGERQVLQMYHDQLIQTQNGGVTGETASQQAFQSVWSLVRDFQDALDAGTETAELRAA